MKYAADFRAKLLGISAFAALLASCGTIDGINDNAAKHISPGSSYGAVSDYPVKIGKPYKVKGKTYTPKDVARYDEVGYTAWYGKEHAGKSTANGERFNPNGISAAHKTLPLPSYVEVTALDSGRTILVRINDRGPFTENRLIDLSYGAAKQLGVVRQGVAAVRVRRVNPSERERATLRGGGAVVERPRASDSLLSVLRKSLNDLASMNSKKAVLTAALAD